MYDLNHQINQERLRDMLRAADNERLIKESARNRKGIFSFMRRNK